MSEDYYVSQTFLDKGQLVGYDFEKKRLIITLSAQMADKMKADGWAVGFDNEIGYFIHIALEEA